MPPPRRAPSETAALAAGLVCITTAGLQYSYGVFSDQLRLRLGLSQQQMGVLAAGKDVGAYAGIVQGLFYDAYGPRRTLLVGGLLSATGWLSLHALSAGASPPRAGRLWPATLALGMAANGGGWLDVASLLTLIHNAGAERAAVAGIGKALLGLGSSFFVLLYSAFLRPDARSYLLLCGLLPLACVFVAAPFLDKLPRPPAPARSPARARQFLLLTWWVFSLVAVSFAVFLYTAFAAEQSTRTLRALVVLLMLLLLAPAIAAGRGLLAPPSIEAPPAADAADVAVALEAEAEKAEAPSAARLQGRGQLELALLFFCLAVGGGGTLTLVNNLGPLAASLRCADPAPYVSLFSVSSSSGRLLAGVLSTHLPLPRAMLLACALALLATTLWAVATSGCAGLYAAVLVAGQSFGSLWVLMPLLVSELWGDKHAGTLYGLLGASPAVGSLVLNTLVAGRVYESHSTSGSCFGLSCFGLTFQLCGAAAAAGAASAWLLHRRTSQGAAAVMRRPAAT